MICLRMLKTRQYNPCLVANSFFHQDAVTGDVNYVELIGTIYRAVHSKSSGRKTIVVRAIEESEAVYHMASTSTIESFAIGQRVQLVGSVGSKAIWTEATLQMKIQIKAFEFYMCPPDLDRDGTRVRLLAKIGSNIEDIDNTTQFILHTTHSPRGYATHGIVATEYHKIIVNDDKLRQYVKTNLVQSDRVLIEGVIRYNLYKNPSDGKDHQSGFILPILIRKIEGIWPYA